MDARFVLGAIAGIAVLVGSVVLLVNWRIRSRAAPVDPNEWQELRAEVVAREGAQREQARAAVGMHQGKVDLLAPSVRVALNSPTSFTLALSFTLTNLSREPDQLRNVQIEFEGRRYGIPYEAFHEAPLRLTKDGDPLPMTLAGKSRRDLRFYVTPHRAIGAGERVGAALLVRFDRAPDAHADLSIEGAA